MRITERTGLIYTALFLTVSVGLITQNSDTLMAKFRGETNVKAVDDIFTVYAGRDQRLFVLSNDVDSQKIQTSEINLLSQPECGKITRSGGTFNYSGSTSCSGHQSFSYCLKTGMGCEPASVALRLVQARDPVDSVANGPTVELSGFETQVGINSRDLEITNVRLGNIAASETTNVSFTSAKLAKIAVETPITISRPAAPTNLGAVAGNFTLPTAPMLKAPAIDANTLVEVAATTDTITDVSPINLNAALLLPRLPNARRGIGPVRQNWATLTARMIKIDTGFRTPKPMLGIDASPFGTACSVTLTSFAVEGGMVELDLKSPCQPNSRVELQHGKMRLTLKSNHVGNLNIEIPAFEENARFQLILADGTKLMASVQVPELAYIDRVAILWRNDFSVELHALEFGAPKNSQGDIWVGHPGNLDMSQRFGGGFVTRLGDTSLAGANLIEVYSLVLNEDVQSGVIDFDVSAWPGQQSCNQNRIIQSLRSRGGRLVGASGIEFTLPACGNSPQSIVLKNVVRDLIIASR